MKIAEMSVELIDYMGSDLSVVNAARVSFAKESDWDYDIKHDGRCNERLQEKDQKLISYLARHNHWSPFAHTSLQFRIKAPIFVARQLVKHQVGGVWNEVSRRYVDDEPEFWFPKVWRGKPVNAKQGSNGEVEMEAHITQGVMDTVEQCLSDYLGMIELGVAPEQARMILPQNTMTEWIWTGSLMFFARVCKLRLDAHAQAETQEVAQMINDLVPKEFEHSWKALME
jgi:thymidylate synthase (FAD)